MNEGGKKEFDLLHKLTVVCRDNGRVFTNNERLVRIDEALQNSPFKYKQEGKLFVAYTQVPVEMLADSIIVVSSHVDLKAGTTRCTSQEIDEEYLVGNYDNSITNAAIVTLMQDSKLPLNVMVVFTGDEEEGGKGAEEVCAYVKKELKRNPKCIVLDVTGRGYKKRVFTIENKHMKKKWQARMMSWFVQCDKNGRWIQKNDDDDESDIYRKEMPCFSLCLPTKDMGADMHSNEGLKVRKKAYLGYIDVLAEVINVAAKLKIISRNRREKA